MASKATGRPTYSAPVRPAIWAGEILVVFGYEYSLVHLRRELGAGLFRAGLR